MIVHQTSPPAGIQKDLKLTLDEFHMFDPTIEVQRIASNESKADLIPIETAVRAQHMKSKIDKRVHFSLTISRNEELDQLIQMPRVIEEKSLYEKYWPRKNVSEFFQNKRKLFNCYQSGFRSRPYLSHGGLTEWIYVMTGSMTITLIEPTELNLIKYETLLDQEDFVPADQTCKREKIEEGHFLVIPPGWITIKKATHLTFTLSGEILHADHLGESLDLFEKYCGIYSEIDTEIRYVCWFYAIHLLKNVKEKKDQQTRLRFFLEKWKLQSALLAKKNDPRSHLFVPSGLRVDKIVRSLHKNTKRRLIKSD